MSILQIKKWYSDFVGDHGDIAGYAYVMALRLFGIPFGNVAVHFSRTNGEEYRATQTFFIGPNAWDDEPVIGKNSIRSDAAASVLSLNLGELKITLVYPGANARWSPSPTAALLDDPHCRIAWQVLQASSPVRGMIHSRDSTIEITGRGYRDLVTLDAHPWSIPARRLLWGRAHCGDYTIVFNRLELVDERTLDGVLVTRNGIVCNQYGTTAELIVGEEGTSLVRGDNFVLTLDRLRILETAEVITPRRIRPGILRNALTRFSRDPRELKIFTGAKLSIEGRECEGYAIHEVVTWGKTEQSTDVENSQRTHVCE